MKDKWFHHQINWNTKFQTSLQYPKNHSLCFWWHWRGICGSFFLSLSFSRSQVINFFKWKHQYLSENIAIFRSNDDLLTQSHFWKKKCHLMTFSWQNESEKTRVRKKKNQKFRTIECRQVSQQLHYWFRYLTLARSIVSLVSMRVCDIDLTLGHDVLKCRQCLPPSII